MKILFTYFFLLALQLQAQPPALKYFTGADVAKFTIATVMGRPPKIITASKTGEYYRVSYNRENDGKRFVYKVKLAGNRAIWANIDGRWRDTAEDEKLTFIESGKKLKITQVFSDGSSGEEVYGK